MIQHLSKDHELRNRILFTILMLLVYLLITRTPVAGIDPLQLEALMKDYENGLLGMFNMFSGGALSRMSLGALGVIPYITAAIIMQLLGSFVSRSRRTKADHEAHRQRITQQTRYLTLVIALIQATGLYFGIDSSPLITTLPDLPSQVSVISVILTFALGTILLMYIGEMITEHGIGNGISLIIAAGIIVEVPRAVLSTFESIRTGAIDANLLSLGFGVVTLAITYGLYKKMMNSSMLSAKSDGMTIAEVAFLNTTQTTAFSFLSQGLTAFAFRILLAALPIIIIPLGFPVVMAYAIFMYYWILISGFKLPVQYPKRNVGSKVYGGQSTHLPLKLYPAGVMPVIFANSILLLPATLITFSDTMNHHSPLMQSLAELLQPGSWGYFLLFGLLIVAFSVFYTKINFNTEDIADNLKKHGGLIPGVRPGASTALLLNQINTKLGFFGGIVLALAVLLPEVLIAKTNTPFYFGGTSLFIVICVALDFIRQIRTHIWSWNYQGFLQKGRSKSQYSSEAPPSTSAVTTMKSRYLVAGIILVGIWIAFTVKSVMMT